MSIQRPLVDYLRGFIEGNGARLGSSHAHEIVASFFGYRSKAALDADPDFCKLEQAWLFTPELEIMNQRRSTLQGLSPSLPNSKTLILLLKAYIEKENLLSAAICLKEDLEAFITEEYLPSEILQIHDDLSGVMAETNATFDEEEYHDIVIDQTDTEISFTIQASINGNSDRDRAFHGDTIDAEIVITAPIIRKNLYGEPELAADGQLNYDWMDPELVI